MSLSFDSFKYNAAVELFPMNNSYNPTNLFACLNYSSFIYCFSSVLLYNLINYNEKSTSFNNYIKFSEFYVYLKKSIYLSKNKEIIDVYNY